MGTTAQKLTYLNQTKEDIKTAINSHGGTLTNQSTFRAYADELDDICTELEKYKDQYPTDTAEGESITITNAQPLPYNDYVIKGKSIQDGTPSPSSPVDIESVADDVNLIDECLVAEYENRGLTWKYDANTKKIKVIGTATSSYSQTDKYNIDLPAGTYTFTVYTESNLAFNIWLYNSNGTLIGNTSVNNPITINEKATKFTLFCEGTTAETEYNEEVNIKIQEGSTATPYSEYGKGTVTIKQRSKNLLDIIPNTVTNRGVELKTDNSTHLTLKGTATQNYPISRGTLNLVLQTPIPAGTYTFSVEGTYEGTTTKAINWEFYDENDNLLQGNIEIGPNANPSKTFTVSSPIKTIKFFRNMLQDVTIDFDVYLQLEEGTQATNYVPYGKDYTIPTEPLRSLPNGVKDTIEAEQDRKIGRQTGTLSQTTTITLSDAKTNGAYMCNIKPSGTLIGKTIELEAGDYEIIYELAEEIIEPFTQQQASTMLDIIKTGPFDGTANIFTDEDIKPTIEVEYYAIYNDYSSLVHAIVGEIEEEESEE